MGLYEVSSKIRNIIKDIYEDYSCTVRNEGEHSEWFTITSGVKQGCIISPYRMDNEENNNRKKRVTVDIYIITGISRLC